MLVIYRESTGEVVENTGTNSYLPQGLPDDLAWGDRDRDGLALLRLHDVDDADVVAKTFTHPYTVRDQALHFGDQVETEPEQPTEPTPDALTEIARLREQIEELRATDEWLVGIVTTEE